MAKTGWAVYDREYGPSIEPIVNTCRTHDCCGGEDCGHSIEEAQQAVAYFYQLRADDLRWRADDLLERADELRERADELLAIADKFRAMTASEFLKFQGYSAALSEEPTCNCVSDCDSSEVDPRNCGRGGRAMSSLRW